MSQNEEQKLQILGTQVTAMSAELALSATAACPRLQSGRSRDIPPMTPVIVRNWRREIFLCIKYSLQTNNYCCNFLEGIDIKNVGEYRKTAVCLMAEGD
jgi:hypothetical protein